MTIGDEKIKKVRSSLQIHQDEFSEKIGLCRKTLGLLEEGEYDPKVGTLKKMAELGKVPLLELLGEKSTVISNPTFNGEKQQWHGHGNGVYVHINTAEQYLQDLLDAKDQLLEEKEKRLVSQEEVIRILKAERKS